MTKYPTLSGTPVVFGPFRLVPQQRLLLRDGKPLRLPRRAAEILEMLTDRAGELVSKRELMERIWPGTFVEEGTLRVHISALRRVLEDGKAGPHYVENVMGLGYRFVAPVIRLSDEPASPVAVDETKDPQPPSPLLPPRIVGREAVVNSVKALLGCHRLVTIVGSGGVGKTVVALAAAQSLLQVDFPKLVAVDLAQVNDPARVVSCVAVAAGIAAGPLHCVSGIATHMEAVPRTLIVLDSCEQVVHAVTSLVEGVLALAPDVHFLVTSREPLRARDESVFRLPALDVPPPGNSLSAARALEFSAVQLFTLRAAEIQASFELRDHDALAVTEICRRLDGLPLAIELAAACMEVFAARPLARSLDHALQLLTRGHRTAAPRHRSLRAMLDWSYQTLSPIGQMALCRLAVFAGSFDLGAASVVLSDTQPQAGSCEVLEVLTGLAAKSLLSTRVSGNRVLFRLLHTSRVYALEKLESSNEGAVVRSRHAQLQGRRWHADGLSVS